MTQQTMTKPTPDAIAAIQAWWYALHTAADAGSGPHRAARARLRRCPALMDAVALPQTHRLLRACREAGLPAAKDDRVILLAIVLADVGLLDRHTGSFASLAGRNSDGKQVPDDTGQLVSRLRFQALLEALATMPQTVDMDDGDAMNTALSALRRAVKLAKGAAFDRRQFIADILFFDPRTARQWNYAYWQTFKPALPPAADAGPPTQPAS